MNIISITTDKHKVEAELLAESFLHKVRFADGDRQVVLGLSISCHGDALVELAKQSVDSYFDRKTPDKEGQTPRLYRWYMDKVEAIDGSGLCAHGVVIGHKKLMDSTFIHTSEVKGYYLDESAGEMVVQTRNTTYRCPMAYCDFETQKKYGELFEDFEELREKYGNAAPRPEIEPGNVLLVLADFCEYYFHSLYVKESEDVEPLKYSAGAHIGTFQDSYLIRTRNDWGIDLRYFPHYGNVEFYSEQTNGLPLYLENIGTSTLYAKTSVGNIKLEPGDRKLVTPENVEQEEVFLAGGDLYPAGFVDDGDEF